MLNPLKQSVEKNRPVEVRRGDWVLVKTLAEIEETLDFDGTLEGLPFMPEMAKLCGRRFRVVRFANQVCANVGTVEIRQLQKVVVLDVRRCDGQFHGGCQMGCDFLWKTQWLASSREPCDRSQAEFEQNDANDENNNGFSEQDSGGLGIEGKLVQLSKVAASDVSESFSQRQVRYRCQATELGSATASSSAFNLRQYRVERKSNGTSMASISSFLARIMARKIFGRSESCEGPCRRTPISSLDLRVGDEVRVKSFDEIVKTLNRQGCNRGLWFDEAEMRPFCGRVLPVTRVINRILNEHTGELMELKVPSVVLNETQCSGLKRRFCGRGMLHFWRSVWLEKLE